MKLTSVTLMFVASLLVGIISNADATIASIAEGIGMDDATPRTSIQRVDDWIEGIRSDAPNLLASIPYQRVDKVSFAPAIARIQSDQVREIENTNTTIRIQMERAEADSLADRIAVSQDRLTAVALTPTVRRARVDAVGITEPAIRLVG